MALRALYRNLHRPPRWLLSTRSSFSYTITQGDLPVPRPTPCLPIDMPGQSPYSSCHVQFWVRSFYTDGERNVSEGGTQDALSITTTQEQLLGDGSMEIFSPVDLMATCLDTLHSATGLPWWATISTAAVVLRMLLFPQRLLQSRKEAEIRKHGRKLQLERLAKGLIEGKFLKEYRLLKERKKGLSCPSLLWIIGPGIFVQVPLVLMIMYSLRIMAVEQHSGFVVGGLLWFKDLTIPAQGLTGSAWPLVIAATYFANVHVLFKAHPVRQGPLGTLHKAWKTFLQCSTAFIFLSFYHVPQAVHMFFVPHSIMTLGQTALFQNEKWVAKMVGTTIKDAPQTPVSVGGQQTIPSSSYETLLKDAGAHFNSGNSQKTIELLENAIKEEPDDEQAYALLGLVYKTKKDWVNSAVYYKQAIAKGKTDDFLIAAYAGCGLALLKGGAVMDCVETMRPIRRFNVPEHPDTRHCYYASLVIFGRALLEAGLKEESEEIGRLAKEVDMKGK